MGFHLIFIVFVLFIKKLQHIMFLPWVAGWWKSKQFATHVLMIDIIFWVPWSLSQSTCLNCYPPMELIWLVLEGYRFLPSFVVFYFIPRPSLRDYEVCIMIEEGDMKKVHWNTFYLWVSLRWWGENIAKDCRKDYNVPQHQKILVI